MKTEPIDIICPDCGGLAQFEEPFEFVSQDEVPPDETRPTHRWGGWIVIERFPSEIHWKAPSESSRYVRGGGDPGQGGYPLRTKGLVRCTHCHANQMHRLNWPSDAYWQWEIRGQLLWAWDKEHAQQILDFIRQTARPARRSTRLKHIPAHFLSAKVRDLVVRKIERSIRA